MAAAFYLLLQLNKFSLIHNSSSLKFNRTLFFRFLWSVQQFKKCTAWMETRLKQEREMTLISNTRLASMENEQTSKSYVIQRQSFYYFILCKKGKTAWCAVRATIQNWIKLNSLQQTKMKAWFFWTVKILGYPFDRLRSIY